MYTGGAGGFESRCPAYGSLAQRIERLVTSQDVAGSSPARPTEHSMFSRCCRALLVVAYVTVRARVVGLRASRWMRYCVSIAARCPPGLPSCSVSVAELVDAPDLGSGVPCGVWVRVPPGILAAVVSCISLLPLTLHSCYSVSERGSPG